MLTLLIWLIIILLLIYLDLKKRVTGQIGNDGTMNVQIMVPSKCLSNFWRNREMSLINCKINLMPYSSINYVISSNVVHRARRFAITKPYVLVLTLDKSR